VDILLMNYELNLYIKSKNCWGYF